MEATDNRIQHGVHYAYIAHGNQETIALRG